MTSAALLFELLAVTDDIFLCNLLSDFIRDINFKKSMVVSGVYAAPCLDREAH